MTVAAGLGGALLLLAPLMASAYPAPAEAVDAMRFAPPLDRPLAYRVTTRRLGRDGSLISFSLLYRLRWQAAGRGYRLIATLDRIDSDARPAIARMLTAALQPLVGEPVTYMVAPDGREIDMIDPDGLWQRVAARTEAFGDDAARAEARKIATLIAALPPADRDRLASADVRAIVAPANDAIPAMLADEGASVRRDGPNRTVAKVESDAAAPVSQHGDHIVRSDMLWTIDTATGLVMRERRQSWAVSPGGGDRTLIEERVRAILSADEL